MLTEHDGCEDGFPRLVKNEVRFQTGARRFQAMFGLSRLIFALSMAARKLTPAPGR
jgi:hypothetical protein